MPAWLGLVVLAVSAWMFVTVHGRLGEERAYDAARLTSVPATVEARVDEHRSRTVRHWLHVSEQGSGTSLRLRMSDYGSDALYESVRPGDRVTLVYWRGEARAVTFDGLTQQTHASPRGDWRLPMGIGQGLVPLGVLLFWTAWWNRHRYPTARARHIVNAGAVWVAGILAGTFAFFACAAGDSVTDVLLVAVCGIPPSAALGALFARLMRRRLRKADDTSDIVPRVPTARVTVRVGIHGDVPYSRAGYGLLVLGDGPPAATADPAGRVARVTLPDTLTVERVRGWRLGEDPDAWPGTYKFNGVVIECRDGERDVLIATRRRDAPLILGALLSPAAV
ncbi:hypothetical protein N4P33_18720 [Streptomyces sp. 15-116A]|uniref:hypothetical protein n=1 Tax=Streptomyces sp. 15-116A TaxID=2259035 RepID=UPI0021B19FA5|nr:hypothetical protein [Streptomyces sp. 15-116A]MCT7354172.1 hypothetical protein [Streptomyces sp. 15-116A]